LHRLDHGPFRAQAFAQLPHLVGHAASGRRQRPGETDFQARFRLARLMILLLPYQWFL
jgi:hypothetical protein